MTEEASGMGYPAGGGAAAAEIARAVRASGVVVHLEPDQFTTVLDRATAPVVVTAPVGLLGRKVCYLTSYKGLAFYTKANVPLWLPADVEVVTARRIWVP
jgi:hypothetical protein